MPGFDVGNKLDLDRLHKAKKTSRDALDPFRVIRAEFIRDFTGSWYSKSGARLYTLVNKLNQTARIYSMALAFNNPQCKVSSFNPQLWPFCRKYEVNINKVVANIDLKTTLQAGVLDAFFLMGIFKCRMADSGYVQTEDNVWIDPGKPWVDRVSFDDVVLDFSAKDIRAMRFIGNRYRVSYRRLMERDDFDKKVLGRVTPTSKFSVDSAGNRASNIASGWQVEDDELEPMCWLEDVYLPETRQIVTFYSDDESLPPLKVMDDDSGPMGPYETLGLGLVPDNIIPSSPAQNLKATARSEQPPVPQALGPGRAAKEHVCLPARRRRRCPAAQGCQGWRVLAVPRSEERCGRQYAWCGRQYECLLFGFPRGLQRPGRQRAGDWRHGA